MTHDLRLGDCLQVMETLAPASVDLILCDLPYGTTACKWDSVIPFDALWTQYRRIAKPNAAIVLTASQPFTTALIASNMEMFKYCLVWEKTRATGHVHAKNKPMKKHEDVCVFSGAPMGHASLLGVRRMTYNPQGLRRKEAPTIRKKGGSSDAVQGARPSDRDVLQEFDGYPHSILSVASESRTVHPTQKPVALMEYLIRTYTNEGDTVLDNCMGSGTTGVACANTGRKFIGIERDPGYFDIARKRIEAAHENQDLFDVASNGALRTGT
jgi:site-specific DNA-methyltransferase (adenine-specific)